MSLVDEFRWGMIATRGYVDRVLEDAPNGAERNCWLCLEVRLAILMFGCETQSDFCDW